MQPTRNDRDKAEAQREAASAAVQMLAERLGSDLPRFVDLFEAASFRFRTALMRRLEGEKRCSGLPKAEEP